MMQLLLLDSTTLSNHIYARYVELASNAHSLKQDLGFCNAKDPIIQVDIEPAQLSRNSEFYTLEIHQSITSLHSQVANNNSTTGYVLWSTTPFWARWLLFEQNASIWRNGGQLSNLEIPGIFGNTAVIELGAGTSGILPIVLGNHVDTYVATDQAGLLKTLQRNIMENIHHLSKRDCRSSTLPLQASSRGKLLQLDILALDWETFHKVPPILADLSNINTIYILAMDVIYNDYLIDPFLLALSKLISFYKQQQPSTQVHALIGLHLRAQDVIEDFLQKAMTDYNLKIFYIQDETLESSRFSFYYI